MRDITTISLPAQVMWLDSAEVARQLGYSAEVFMRDIASAPGFPKPATARAGARPRWNAAEVDEYMRSRRVNQAA